MRLKILIPLLFLLSGCAAPVPGMSTGIGTGQPVDDGSAAQLPATLPAASLPTPNSSLAASSTIPATVTPLALNILYPLNNAIVGEGQINLTGNVSKDAVVSVNDKITLLPAGDFSIPIVLEEGPNALEIVVSDYEGNEMDLILVVTYQP